MLGSLWKSAALHAFSLASLYEVIWVCWDMCIVERDFVSFRVLCAGFLLMLSLFGQQCIFSIQLRSFSLYLFLFASCSCFERTRVWRRKIGDSKCQWETRRIYGRLFRARGEIRPGNNNKCRNLETWSGGHFSSSLTALEPFYTVVHVGWIKGSIKDFLEVFVV
jgi:hypothetical protein